MPVDDLTPVAYAPDLKLTQLPAAIHGTLTGDQTHSAVFTGKKGERVQVEIEARRLGGKLRPVIHLYDAHRVQLAYAQTMRTAGGDARLSFELPSDGEYRVEWHDALYKGEAPGVYRMKVGQYANIGHRYPLVTGELYDGELMVPITHFYADGTIRAADDKENPKTISQAWPSMSQRTSRIPLAVEAQSADNANWKYAEIKRQRVPVSLSGILVKPGEEDRWTINIEPGKAYRFAVIAAQADSPVDAVLTIYDAEGKKQLMSADDATKSADPMLEYTVPKGMQQLTVAIKDLLGRGGWEYAYNIEVTEAKSPLIRANFEESTLYLPAGGRMIYRIDTSGPTLAKQFDLKENAAAELLLQAAKGKDELNGSVMTPQKVMLEQKDSPLSRGNPKFARAIHFLHSGRSTPFTLDWSVEPTQLPRGGELKLALQVVRSAGVKGPVRLSLLTNQPRTDQDDQRRESGQDRAREREDAPSRGQSRARGRCHGGERHAASAERPLTRQVSTRALRGELLSLDGKRVLAVTTTTIATPKTVYPLQLALDTKLDPKKPAEVRAGTGDTVELKGKIERTLGTATPVRVTVEGWPAGLPAPLADLSAEQTEFVLPLRLPFKESKAALKERQAGRRGAAFARPATRRASFARVAASTPPCRGREAGTEKTVWCCLMRNKIFRPS